MTVSSSTNRVSYSGNGTLTTFAYTFKIFDQDDLTVILRAADGTETVQTITTHYTVTNVGNASGGNVEFITAPSATETVVIVREQPFTQGLDLVPNDPFPAQSLEESLDKLTFVDQRLNEKIDRALTFSVGDVVTDATLPVKELRVGKVLAFNETTGNPEAGPTIADTESIANVSADIATLADIQDGTVATNAITNVNTIRTDVTTVSGISANVTTVATNNANVTTVATDLSGSDTIGTVAGSISNVNTVATDITNVNTTATNIADVNTVAGEIGVSGVVTIVANAITDVSTVSGDIAAVITAANDLNEAVSEIDTVANAITNVDTVGTNIANVNTVAGISSDVTTVAADGTDIGTVATNITNVNTVAGISSNVTTVAGISADVTTVAADGADIGTVATNIANVNAVGGISANVTTVAGISANVTTVAGISANVTTVAGDTANIGTIATNLNGTDTIGTVAGSISNVNSVGGAISDVTTVASNLTDVQSFANTYRIGATDPTTSLDTGDLFFNTSSGVLKVYNGSAWEAGVTAGSGFMPLTGGTFTGDVSFGDNDKAIFGAGSDLQIFHDGSHSYISDQGTGNLRILADNLYINNAANSQNYISGISGGALNLFYAGSQKLATTSTGVDITGTLTSDGLTVGGGGSDAVVRIDTEVADKSDWRLRASDSGSEGELYIEDFAGAQWTPAIKFSNGGDISFYEDTGTTAKFFWDASAERLGIGTSSPSHNLHISSSSGSTLALTAGVNDNAQVRFGDSSDDDAGKINYDNSTNHMAFHTNASERMRIDSSGNVGIGESSTDALESRTAQGYRSLRLNNFNINAGTGSYGFVGQNIYQDTAGAYKFIDTGDSSSIHFWGNAMQFHMANGSADATQGSSEKMRIDSSGNLLVGTTTSPSGSGKLALAKGVVETTTTVTYASSIALTYDNGSIQTVTLTGNVTFTDSLADGEAIVLMLNAGASYTVTWTAVDKWVSSGGNAAPTLTANDTIVLWKIGSTVYAAYAGSYT